MKFKIILLVGFILIACTFALFTKRYTYFSNSGERKMEERFFDLDCKLIEATGTAGQKLKIDFDFHTSDQQTILQLSVIPIRNNIDTLKIDSNNTINSWIFLFPKTAKTNKLDLIVNYKVDSAGIKVNKSIKYYKLEKTYTYHFQPPFQ